MTATIKFSTPAFDAEIIQDTLEAAYQEYKEFVDKYASSENSFEVTEMGASVHEGKTYWKAKGGIFRKYGVTVWDEVFEATGGKLTDLDSSVPYILPAGTIAEYILNEDGKPKKVTKLIYPADAPELAVSKDDFFARLTKETGITEIGTLVGMIKAKGISSYDDSIKARAASAVRGMVKA